MIYSDDDVHVLAQTIYGEARGESDEGKQAVANVVLNRLRFKPRYGNSPASVCRQRALGHDGKTYVYQFSCWNTFDNPEQGVMSAIDETSPVFLHCLGTARKVLLGAPDLTRGATHYCTLDTNPAWSYADSERKVPLVPTCVIGKHKFYTGVR